MSPPISTDLQFYFSQINSFTHMLHSSLSVLLHLLHLVYCFVDSLNILQLYHLQNHLVPLILLDLSLKKVETDCQELQEANCKLLPEVSLKNLNGRRSQDGGGVGRGDHFLFYKFIERTTERWTKFTKKLLIASSGHQAPRKAAHCLQRVVGQKY